MNDSWRASGRLRQLGPTGSTTSTVLEHRRRHLFRRAPRSAPLAGQAFYINYPDRRESSTMMRSGSHHLNQTASIRPTSRQQTCSLTLRGLPVAALHTRAVLSELAVTIRVPSGLNAALLTDALCSRGLLRGLPVAALHTRAVLSELAVTIRVPSGLNVALTTNAWCWSGGTSGR
jgi:hypothetical protein